MIFTFSLTAALLAFVASPHVRSNPRLLWSFLCAAGALFAWQGVLFAARASRRAFRLDVALRPQHYVQACAHASIYLYWGWHWRVVYDVSYLIAAQLLFAYVFDALLTWSRGTTYTLGMGPFPIVFSTNLFLWFREDWFYLQFLMLAVGFAGKALIRWERDGRMTHVFNPSALPLTVFSLALLATGTSHVTWGQDIAVTQFFPPHMYLFLFLVALPGQLLFGVTTMTLAAVVTTYVWGLAYYGVTGTYYFYDAYIPIAVFLGMHLLFTDPSTSPRTDAGRVVFGMLYGLSTVALYAGLGAVGLPAFYDKLLQVPLLNLMVGAIDRACRPASAVAAAGPLHAFDPSRLWPALTGRRRHAAYVAVWAVVFGVMSAAQGVGDRHPGQWPPFWRQACLDNRAGACRYLTQMYERYCRAGSSWSCGERDRLATARIGAGQTAGAAHRGGEAPIGTAVDVPAPPVDELPILLRGSKGPVTDRDPASLRARGCSQGWRELCEPVMGARNGGSALH